jgi:soluble lytic murein transglycosylase-like protein
MPNLNGSADLGLMQVNTIWVKPLARYTGMTESAVLDRLIDDPCFNITAAAAIMKLYMAEARGDFMLAIGYYHSHTPDLGSAYQQKVLAAAGLLFQKRRDRIR